MKTTAGAVFAACLMLSTPAWSQSIPELEPYLESDDSIKGTPSGEGTYTDVIIGTGDSEAKAGRLSLSLDGQNLTDLVIEDMVLPLSSSGETGKAKRIVVENSSIPLSLEAGDEKAIFEWLLNLNADRLAIEGMEFTDKGGTLKIATLEASNVRDGYVETVAISGVTGNGINDDGKPFTVTLDDMRLNGIGVGWLIYLRMAELDGSTIPESDRVFSGPDFAYLKDFKLADHQHHLRLVGMSLDKMTVAVQDQPLFDLAEIDYDVTAYSGSLPIAATAQMNGAVNLETIEIMAKDDPQASLGLQAFRALYGQPTVGFSAAMEQTWNDVEKVATLENFDYVFDKLARISLRSVFSGYNPEDMIAALDIPDDEFTMVSMMETAEMSQTSIKVTDLGALDIGFALAPPTIKRDQIALQAAQIAGIGVVQAMQMGIKLNGSIAEVLSGFISNGGTIEVRQSPGAAIPMAKFYEWLVKPDDQAAAMSLLSTLDLEVVGSQ